MVYDQTNCGTAILTSIVSVHLFYRMRWGHSLASTISQLFYILWCILIKFLIDFLTYHVRCTIQIVYKKDNFRFRVKCKEMYRFYNVLLYFITSNVKSNIFLAIFFMYIWDFSFCINKKLLQPRLWITLIEASMPNTCNFCNMIFNVFCEILLCINKAFVMCTQRRWKDGAEGAVALGSEI